MIAFAFPRLLSAIDVERTIEMNESNAIVAIANPKRVNRESLFEIDGINEKIIIF